MDSVQQRILDVIDSHSDELIAFAEDIYKHAEPGFREFRTADIVAEKLQALGLKVRENLAITGVKAWLRPNHPTERTVSVCGIGELDGIKCPRHEFANPETGLSHTCGHHTQLGAMLGAAISLSDQEVHPHLDGTAVFFAVPSEEFSDLDYKTGLMRKGKIKYGGGKSELIRIGAFDDVQICVNHHLHMVKTHSDVLLGNNTTNGFIVKNVTFRGRASHAAIAPHNGINALNAANLAMAALQYQRETFKDEDHVRVHAIISHGGDMVNVVPEKVVIEAQVRAKYMAAMNDACKKADRSFRAGALAIGANVEIHDLPGYLPILEEPIPKALLETGDILKNEVSVAKASALVHNPASTDVGDLTHLMPVVGFTTGGFKGALHSADFEITDKYKAYVLPAKVMALTMYNLLRGGAKEAHALIERFPHHLSRHEYMEYMDSFDNK